MLQQLVLLERELWLRLEKQPMTSKGWQTQTKKRERGREKDVLFQYCCSLFDKAKRFPFPFANERKWRHPTSSHQQV